MKTPILITIACVGCLGLGWAVGRLDSGGPASAKDGESAAKGASISSGADSRNGEAEGASGGDAAMRSARALSTLVAASRRGGSGDSYREALFAIRELGPGDIQAALKFAGRSRRSDAAYLIPEIIAHWAKTDPKAAAEYSLGIKDVQPSQRLRAIGSSAAEWVKKDPLAAKEWVRNMESMADRRTANTGIATGLLAADP